MELINATKMQAGYTMGKDPDGRDRLVVAVKGTFAIPDSNREAELAVQQAPLVMADTFTGEPGFSATVYEADYPPAKPRCDVLLNGSAYAPGGGAQRVNVTLSVAGMTKSFEVVGDRVWDKTFLSVVPTEPAPFAKMPITYDRAFGGVDAAQDKADKKDAFKLNPVGVGHYPLTTRKALPGKRLPNTQAADKPVQSPTGHFYPMSFGAIGRNFGDRAKFAGTYDQNWLDNVFPFLPGDFDARYYQCAPPEQQIDYPKGGEQVTLTNLTPAGRTSFRLPTVDLPVEFTNASYERTKMIAVLDTIVIEPDASRMLLTWRASIALKRNMFEIKQAVIGHMSRGWYRARDLGKTYYPSLKHLTDARTDELAGGAD